MSSMNSHNIPTQKIKLAFPQVGALRTRTGLSRVVHLQSLYKGDAEAGGNRVRTGIQKQVVSSHPVKHTPRHFILLTHLDIVKPEWFYRIRKHEPASWLGG